IRRVRLEAHPVKTGFDPMLERAPLGNLTPGKRRLRLRRVASARNLSGTMGHLAGLPGLTPLRLSLQRLHQYLTVGRRTERGGKNGEGGAVEHHPDGRKTTPIESSITIRDCAW